jgi:hypothetical protein
LGVLLGPELVMRVFVMLSTSVASALARTPSKLTMLLLSQPGITQEILSSQLEIIEGDREF